MKRHLDPDRRRILERIFANAEQHGQESEPCHEVGDLQDALREAVARIPDVDIAYYIEEVLPVSSQICKSYNGECPDCEEDIPLDVEEGEECENCGHVFCLGRESDDTEEQTRRDEKHGLHGATDDIAN